ncbi:MAG: 3-hydroxyacyl-CoA dehydrogenase NAD-binding domain-containing protein [Prolixibacteraceae bacterium]|nr:3-hydroxyacyl-CoA dehydrogenase NAD-binding domain-containing protein [Prolixibacteraceae bacterium]
MSKEVIHEPIENFGLSKRSNSSDLFSKVGIVGCGAVGQNLSRICSFYGMEVVFVEVSDEKVTEALDSITQMLDYRIEHWGLTSSEKRAILSRIEGTIDMKKLAGCDIVIEAIRPENRGLKIDERKEIFREIEEIVDEKCIIAANSATVVITELSSDLKNRERCVGIYFFIGTPNAPILEVVRGLYTSEESYVRIAKFVKQINRSVVSVDESAGLVSIRIFVTLLNEACSILMEGVASLEDIDLTLRACYGMRSGVFEMADKMGLGKIVRWMENIYAESGEVKYKPSPVLRKLVRAKHLGVVSGRGFYTYDDDGKKVSVKKNDF